jgi:hypothetical protein
MWEGAYGPGSNLGMANPDLAGMYDQYIREYGDRKSPPTPDDRRYLDVHEGHYVYLKEGEEQFVSSEVMASTLTGTGEQINKKLDELEAVGVNNVAMAAVTRQAASELIADFSEQVIQKR